MRAQLPYIAFSVALIGALHLFVAFPLGYTALAVLVAWPLIGTLITIDDDLPGGFSNPDGSVKPPWLRPENWGDLAFRASIAALAFALEFALAGYAYFVPLGSAATLAALGWVLVYGSSSRRSANG
jgi:hypothetical protein